MIEVKEKSSRWIAEKKELEAIYNIMKSHKGNIQIEKEEREGAVFRLFFPKLEEYEEECDTHEKVIGGKEKILFVDDDPEICNVVALLLESLGYQVTFSQESMKILDLLKENPLKYNLLITDQTMPLLSGIELAKKAVKINPNLPIILCTGYDVGISHHRAKSMGIREICIKPFSRGELAKKVRGVLDQKEK